MDHFEPLWPLLRELEALLKKNWGVLVQYEVFVQYNIFTESPLLWKRDALRPDQDPTCIGTLDQVIQHFDALVKVRRKDTTFSKETRAWIKQAYKIKTRRK